MPFYEITQHVTHIERCGPYIGILHNSNNRAICEVSFTGKAWTKVRPGTYSIYRPVSCRHGCFLRARRPLVVQVISSETFEDLESRLMRTD